jgi:hypothetical protein
MTLRVESFLGADVARYLPAIAVLRIEVFREWPYLYDGSVEYEEKYLAGYTGEGAMVAIAFDGDELVGAATALPLVAHSDAVAPPLVAAGFDPEGVYYFGESVLRHDRRGRGLGHRFFTSVRPRAGGSGTAWRRSAPSSGRARIRGGRPRMCPTTGSGPSAALSGDRTSWRSSRGRTSATRGRPRSRWCSG